MNPDRTDLNDLTAIARTTRSARQRRAIATAIAEIERLRAAGCDRNQTDTPSDDIVKRLRGWHDYREVASMLEEAAIEIERLHLQDQHRNAEIRFLSDRNRYLEGRIQELERHTDWHIDMVLGDAWLCRIEGKYEDICDLLGEAVGKQITAYEIDTSHHESTDP